MFVHTYYNNNYMYIYIYIYTCIFVYICIHIYIYREREREGDTIHIYSATAPRTCSGSRAPSRAPDNQFRLTNLYDIHHFTKL